MHSVLKNSQYESWKVLENAIEELDATTEKGTAFEDFVHLYLTLHKTMYQIDSVYKSRDIPETLRRKYEIESHDCGIDGLIILQNGKVAAYQAKFRSLRDKPPYAELAKFWAEARKVDYQYTIANCYSLSKLCNKNKKHMSILVDDFDRLDESFFYALYGAANHKKTKPVFHKPDKYQNRIISNVCKGFETNRRGKLIAACGTGKTLTALWISERLETKTILFITPSLALVKQTLKAWSEQSKTGFNYICVCSDQTVSHGLDEGDIKVSDLGVPVTTSATEVSSFMASSSDTTKIIFSTYQSLKVIADSAERNESTCFEMAIFDEAHRTAGAKESNMFSWALDDDLIYCEKRLFMTATERMLTPRIKKKAEEYDRTVFSMDDETIYGVTFDRLTFGEAIDGDLISDYKIIIAGLAENEILNWIKNNALLVQHDVGSEEYFSCAQNIFRQVMLLKTMKQFEVNKVITFHSTISNAQKFISDSQHELNLKIVFEKLRPNITGDDLYFDHINGTMSAEERREKFNMFETAERAVISNARCLTEGVDVPIIDAIYFVNPKHSLIDIVQACGRALRKPRDGSRKIAYFIVPIIIPEGEKDETQITNEVDFEMVFNLIQSLRDQDQRLADWVDKINLHAATGEGSGGGGDNPIIVDIPQEYDLKKFEEQLHLKIADVNSEPTQYAIKTKKYGRGERRSSYKRIFKTLGDYSTESYKKNLVLPTLQKFADGNEHLTMTDLKINHNNVSHTVRLGLIRKEKGEYHLTPLGIELHERNVDFEAVFRNQMLRYFSSVKQDDENRILFPYRACLKVLSVVKKISFIEFVFGLYSMMDSSDDSVSESIEYIAHIRYEFPNIELLNEKNKKRVLASLNEECGTDFTETDIWKKKTTVNNQYIYFRNHLTLFNEFIEIDKEKNIVLKEDGIRGLKAALEYYQDYEKITNLSMLKDQFSTKPIVVQIFDEVLSKHL